MKKNGFSLTEALMTMLIMSVVLAATLPVITVMRHSITATADSAVSYVSTCIRDENAASIHFDAVTGKLDQAFVATSSCASSVTACVTGNASCNDVKTYTMSGSIDQKYAGEKILRSACDRGGAVACNYFVDKCSTFGLCDITGEVTNPLQNFFDLKYYLVDTATVDASNVSISTVYDYANTTYQASAPDSSIVSGVNTLCTASKTSSACKIVFDNCTANATHACDYFVNRCAADSTNASGGCDVTTGDVTTNTYDLRYFLDLISTNVTAAKTRILSSATTNYSAISSRVNEYCPAGANSNNNTACQTIFGSCNGNNSTACSYFADRCAINDSCDVGASNYDLAWWDVQTGSTAPSALISSMQNYYPSNAAVKLQLDTNCANSSSGTNAACRGKNPYYYSQGVTSAQKSCNGTSTGACYDTYANNLNRTCKQIKTAYPAATSGTYYLSGTDYRTPVGVTCTMAAYPRATVFAFTGAVQTYTVPETGTYTIEAIGAQGNSNSGVHGGKGGMVRGDVNLVGGTVLYVYVGGMASWFNGAGRCATPINGGGGTDVRIGADYKDRIIVGGGGGGSTYGQERSRGGDAGALGTDSYYRAGKGGGAIVCATDGVYYQAGGGGGGGLGGGGSGGGSYYGSATELVLGGGGGGGAGYGGGGLGGCNCTGGSSLTNWSGGTGGCREGNESGRGGWYSYVYGWQNDNWSTQQGMSDGYTGAMGGAPGECGGGIPYRTKAGGCLGIGGGGSGSAGNSNACGGGGYYGGGSGGWSYYGSSYAGSGGGGSSWASVLGQRDSIPDYSFTNLTWSSTRTGDGQVTITLK